MAARWAADRFAPDAAITLLHVIERPRMPRFLEGLFARGEDAAERLREQADRDLAAVAESLDARRVRTELRTGDPASTIAEMAEAVRADVVVGGAHGGGRGRAGILGTTVERLAGASSVPVLVATRPPPAEPRRVLAVVDESEYTRPVLRWARLLARRFRADLLALHVIPPVFYGPVTFAPSIEEPHGLMDEVEARTRRWLEDALREAGVEPGAADVHVRRGQAAFVVPEEAERTRAELIVLGSRGAGALRRLLLGSTASLVLRSSTRPVLIVPAGRP